MNRRAFLVSSFILGLNAALGNRIKAPLPLYFRGEDDYLRVKPFRLDYRQTYYIPTDREDLAPYFTNTGD